MPNKPQPTSPGTIILQWLSYAFWGWLIVGLLWLFWTILANFIGGTDTADSITYATAASIVLLPIAFITDWFYRKHETVKHGASMVIMVVHAVLFALIAIGSLVGAVLTGINLLLSTSLETSSPTTILLTLIFSAVAYGLLFLRVINPFKTKRFSLGFDIGMLAAAIVLLILAVVGPIAQSVSTKDDRLIRDNLYLVSSAVDSYVSQHGNMPNTLSELSVQTDAGQYLINHSLVTYKSEGLHTDTTPPGYYYQLCVPYKASAKQDGFNYNPTDRESTPSTYSHPAGNVCYALVSYDYAKLQ